ncbi:type VI secretion system-associated protein TagO [Flavimaricola marinus]|uniref:Type VI secretion-associated protein, VC_A0118 family n=1 Tax=Flavimaricola marinus TaxID=1819565 RepID=A0A238LAW2_9RHOB|nr:type VI secretion system-associated protein TagO [Flavimaricola marinus]SMY06565.1 hypothetical protein LOM8899_00692 [Flavimaricola marinus]
MRFLLLSLAATAALFTTSSQADPLDCHAIETDVERLSCYDRETDRRETTETTPDQSDWTVRTETSDFDDSTSVFLTTLSEERITCGFGGAQQLTLYARCMENTTSLIIATHCHVASGFQGYGDVEYRIDDAAVQTRGFTESTNNRSLGLWNGGRSIPFLQSMFDAETLLVRFTPFNENPVVARFPIAGLREAIAPLRESCNW